MPDINDVVRHVILRILVDGESLSGDLAKARAQLKGLEDAEKDSNKRRAKSFEDVSKAAQKYTDALKENQRVSEGQAQAAEKSAKSAAAAHKESAAAVKDETKAINDKTIAEARAAEIEEKTRQYRLKADAERKRYNQTTVADAEKNAAKLAAIEEKARQDRLAGDAKRKRTNQDTTFAAQKAETDLAALREKLDGEQANRDQTAFLRQKGMKDKLKQIAKEAAVELEKTQERLNKLAEDTRNTRLGGQVTRTNQVNESNAGISRRDRSTDAAAARQDANAAAARARQDDVANTNKINSTNKTNAEIERRDKESDQRILSNNEKLNAALRKSDDDLARSIVENAEKIATAKQKGLDTRLVSQAGVGKAQSQENLTVAREQNQLDKNTSDAVDRRTRSQTLANREIKEQVAGAKQLQILEERLKSLAASRADAEERFAANAARRAKTATSGLSYERTRRGVGGFLEGALAPNPSRDTDSDNFRRSFKENASTLRGDTAAVTSATRAYETFRTTIARVNEVLPRLKNGLRAARDELRETKGGGGSSAFTSIASGVEELASRFTSSTGPLLRFFSSFRGVIIIAIAALGPLAAAMGAVGAAALGLASNMAALSGVLFALPGLLSAAVAGFGALALIIKPLSGVFSAYTAAQKAATTATADSANTAKDAAQKLQAAQYALTAAQLASQRATQDAPRAQDKLSDAYKTASRRIEDYRLALKKLEYDQTSASLGVESAEQEYRRTLADPTANNLDRKVARNNVVGSLFDQAQTKLDVGRTEQDANEALNKGVEGSDEVIQAKRDIADANLAIQTTALAAKQAQLALNEAELDSKAGGSAARKAQDELNAQLDALGPKTRTVVKSVLDLGDAYKAMRNRLSDRLFGQLTGDTGKFADVLESVEKFLGPTADALGALAHEAITLFTNPSWKAFFERQGDSNGKIIKTLGEAALSAADGFKAIIDIARPFTDFVVDGLAGFAKNFKDFAESDTGSAKITDFLALTMKRMKELAPVIGNIIGGFLGFFKALNTPYGKDNKDFTTRINEGLGELAAKFNDLGKKAGDKNGGFLKWLEDIGPLIKEVVHFTGQVASFFGDLFKDPKNIQEAKDIFQAIGEKFLPAMADVLSSIADSGIISKIIGGIAGAVDSFSKFLDLGGASSLSIFSSGLELIGNAIDLITSAIKKATEVFPPLGLALKGILSTLALIAAGALLGKLTGLFAVFKGARFIGEALGFGGTKSEQPQGTKARLGNARDSITDKLFGRDSGQTAAQRDIANGATPRNATGGVLPTLYRMEAYLKEIVVLLAEGDLAGTGSRSTKAGKAAKAAEAGAATTTAAERTTRRTTRSPLGTADPSYSSVTDVASDRRLRTTTELNQVDLRNDSASAVSRYNDRRTTSTALGEVVNQPYNRTSEATRRLAQSDARLARRSPFSGAINLAATTPIDQVTSSRRTATTLPGRYDGDLSYNTDDEPTTADRPRQYGGTASEVSAGTTAPPRQSRTRRLFNRLRTQLGNDDGSIPLESSRTRRESTTSARSAGRGRAGLVRNLFRGGEEVAESSGGRRALGSLARGAGGLARGLAGGLIGGAVAYGAQVGGDYLTDKFVKDDEDAASLHRGLGAVANGAQIGGLIGSVVPGVGTVIGGAVGGLAGGAYSLIKDKNLRNFVGGKISSGAKAVGGFVGNAFNSVRDTASSVFSGKDEDGNKLSVGQRIAKGASLLGPVGALLGGTDIGKTITDSLGKATDRVSDFFTKTIPGAFRRGVITPISNFFTKTLPSLPGRAFDAITTGAGIVFGFFTTRLPRITREFFTRTLPNLASDAWDGVRTNLFEPIGTFITETIPKFFTDTIPHWFDNVQTFVEDKIRRPIIDFITVDIPKFFTDTIPKWFEAAPQFFEDNVITPITNFFTTTLPEFFTTTLPNAIASLPGVIYSNLVQPVVDFFSGLAGHVGDFLSGSFDWARNLFTRGSKNFQAGADSQKATSSMSGGLVDGIYQGIEDNKPYLLTAEEFVVRRGAVKQPGGKMFLRDYNEGRITPAQIYAGLSAQAAPPVMSLVAPGVPSLSGVGVSNTTVTNNPGYSVGDITIHNPVREKSDRSLRRQLQAAAIRHRR